MLARDPDHAVCFHDGAIGLVTEVADYLEPALSDRGAGLLLARRSRIEPLQRLLSQRGLNLAELRERGQVLVVDAEGLSEVCAGDTQAVDARFGTCIAQEVRGLVNRWGHVRAFGEAVDCLAADGHHTRALSLESRWTALQREVPFDLLCGYEFQRFGPGAGEQAFQHVCDAHTDVYALDGEAWTVDRLRREVAVLRHRLRTQSLARVDGAAGPTSTPTRAGASLLPLGGGPGKGSTLPSRLVEDLGPLTAGRLLNVVVHDLQNVMAAMRWNTLSAIETVPSDGQAQEALSDVLMGVERCSDLVSDVLGITRPSALGPTPLDDLIAGQKRLLGRVVGHKAKLGFELGCSRCVTLSPTACSQVLTNLVVNACHAVRRGGQIEIRTSTARRRRTERNAGRWAVLEVTDDGDGIEPELLGRVFDESFTTAATGTGLGLAIVRAVVERAGGQVEAESELGRGSLFRVLLPIH
jgi:signal transduction histidine kinase